MSCLRHKGKFMLEVTMSKQKIPLPDGASVGTARNYEGKLRDTGSRGPKDNVTARPERDKRGNLPGSRVRLVKVDRMGNVAGNPQGGSDAGLGSVH